MKSQCLMISHPFTIYLKCYQYADYSLALLWEWEKSSNCVTSSKQGGLSQEPAWETLLMIFNTNKRKKRRASSHISYLKWRELVSPSVEPQSEKKDEGSSVALGKFEKKAENITSTSEKGKKLKVKHGLKGKENCVTLYLLSKHFCRTKFSAITKSKHG